MILGGKAICPPPWHKECRKAEVSLGGVNFYFIILLSYIEKNPHTQNRFTIIRWQCFPCFDPFTIILGCLRFFKGVGSGNKDMCHIYKQIILVLGSPSSQDLDDENNWI